MMEDAMLVYIEQPPILRAYTSAINQMALMKGVYIHNSLTLKATPESVGEFKIAQPYTLQEEMRIREAVNAGQAVGWEAAPDWLNGVSARPFALQGEIFDAIIHGEAKTVVMAIGRQFGKTWIGAMSALYYALNYPGSLIYWFAPYDWQAKSAATKLERLLVNCPHRWRATMSSGDYKIDFEDKDSRIIFKQAQNDKGIRGETADVIIIDEAAFINGDTVEAVIRPLGALRLKKMIIMSTPFGFNWFYDYFRAGQDQLRDRIISFRGRTADNPLVPEANIEEARQFARGKSFEQEYLAEFIEDGGSVFTGIREAVIDRISIERVEPYFCGIDLGSKQDWTVLTVLNANGEMVHLSRFQFDWDDTVRRLASELDEWGWPAGYIETNGVGAVADLLFKHELNRKRRLWGFQTNAKTKEKMIQELELDIKSKAIGLLNDEALLSEMRMFTFKMTKNGHFQYSARQGFHDDCVMSLAMANQARRNLK